MARHTLGVWLTPGRARWRRTWCRTCAGPAPDLRRTRDHIDLRFDNHYVDSPVWTQAGLSR